MWSGKKPTTQRPGTVLLIDADEPSTAALAQRLGDLGVNVFYTAASHVGRRLSQEHYFDLVVVDTTIDRETQPHLSELIARDGHRCVVLSVPAGQRDFQAEEHSVRGALHRPLGAERIQRLAAEVVRNGNFDGYREMLDLTRE